jgi:hypothetical protein
MVRGLVCLYLAQYRNQLRAVVNIAVNLRVEYKRRKFVTS